jgi:hypothetical protein
VAVLASSANQSEEVSSLLLLHPTNYPSLKLGLTLYIGGKKFSRNLQPLNADGEVENMWAVCGSLVQFSTQLTMSSNRHATPKRPMMTRRKKRAPKRTLMKMTATMASLNRKI